MGTKTDYLDEHVKVDTPFWQAKALLEVLYNNYVLRDADPPDNVYVGNALSVIIDKVDEAHAAFDNFFHKVTGRKPEEKEEAHNGKE